MKGEDWLARAKEQHGPGVDLRNLMNKRIGRKVGTLAPGEVKNLLESFGGPNGAGSQALQVEWLGCWSQSLDQHLRYCLGKKMLADQAPPRPKRKRKKRRKLKTVGKYELHEVFDHIADEDREFDGWVAHMGSLRYHTFRRSIRCAQCGMEATCFLLQAAPWMNTNPPNRAHFNLYSERPDGTLVLFTKDHIVPKSKGGSNRLSNLQTMCRPCNAKKADQEVDGPGPFHPVQ